MFRRMEILLECGPDCIEVNVAEGDDALLKLQQEVVKLLPDGCRTSDCYKFQRWSEKWKCNVNVVSASDIKDGDKITTVIKRSEVSAKEDVKVDVAS